MEASLNTAGCALTVAQWHTLLVTGIANVPLHQANPAMLLGSGVCYLDNGYAYVSDWNTIAGLGFVDIHVYGWGNPATYFSSMLAQYSAWAATTQAAHQLVVAGESMWPQWVPSGQASMSEAYQGFGAAIWWTNGVGPLWLRDVAGIWARGNGFSVWSIWSNEPFFYSSNDPNSTVTYPGLVGDTYEPSAMTAVVAGAPLTPLGQMFAQFIKGTVASGQSRVTVNGRAIIK